MKQVYVITSQTQTFVGKIIRWITKKPYNHNSISFGDSHEGCYGMGRTVISNPLSARLIRESFLLHPHYKNTNIVVTAIDVEDETFNHMKEQVETMYENGEMYRYNYLGFIGYFLRRGLRPHANRFNCSQFVGHILDQSDIRINGKHPDMLVPLDFVESTICYTVYEGPLEFYFMESSWYESLIKEI